MIIVYREVRGGGCDCVSMSFLVLFLKCETALLMNLVCH